MSDDIKILSGFVRSAYPDKQISKAGLESRASDKSSQLALVRDALASGRYAIDFEGLAKAMLARGVLND